MTQEFPITPVQHVRYQHPEGAVLHFDIKRDDLIHPYISGNKWRKLKYHLQAARTAGKTELLSFGGAWSNHLLALAFAAARAGLQSRGLVRGEAVSNPVLQLCQLMGMQLEFVSREAYRDKAMLSDSRAGLNTYVIPEGGYGTPGARGCAELIGELPRSYAHILCACGTGTTLAGLAHGAAARDPLTRLHGVPVLRQGAYLKAEIEGIYPGLDNYQLHTGYHFGGYGKTRPELHGFVLDFSRQTGILIEPTYTGKALYALLDLMLQGNIPDEQRPLFIHTGGLTGLLGHLNKLIPGHTANEQGRSA